MVADFAVERTLAAVCARHAAGELHGVTLGACVAIRVREPLGVDAVASAPVECEGAGDSVLLDIRRGHVQDLVNVTRTWVLRIALRQGRSACDGEFSAKHLVRVASERGIGERAVQSMHSCGLVDGKGLTDLGQICHVDKTASIVGAEWSDMEVLGASKFWKSNHGEKRDRDPWRRKRRRGIRHDEEEQQRKKGKNLHLERDKKPILLFSWKKIHKTQKTQKTQKEKMIVQALIRAAQADKQATQWLKSQESKDYREYMRNLSLVLAKDTIDPTARNLAGILLSRVDTRKLSVDLKNSICGIACSTLEDKNPHVARSAAHLFSEFAQRDWRTMITPLIRRSMSPTASPNHLLCLQWTIEPIGPHLLEHHMLELLRICSLHAKSSVVDIREASVRLLLQLVPSLGKIVERESNKNNLLSLINGFLRDSHANVQALGFFCMSEIATHFYFAIAGSMASFGPVLQRTIVTKSDFLISSAIEFWACLAETKTDCESNYPSWCKSIPSCRSVLETAITSGGLDKYLFQCLTKQSEDKSESSLADLAAICLSAVCKRTGALDPMLKLVGQFIKHPNWRCQEAALTMFGCCFEGVDFATEAAKLAKHGWGATMSIVVQPEAAIQVRETALWLLGRMFFTCPPGSLDPQLQHAMPILLKLVQASTHPRLLTQTLVSLGMAVHSNPTAGEEVIQVLIKIADKLDPSLHGLLFETMGQIVVCLPKGSKTISQFIDMILTRLFQRREPHLRKYLCLVLGDAFKVASETDALRHAERTIRLVGPIATLRQPVTDQTLEDAQEGLLCLQAMIERVGPRIHLHINELKTIALANLESVDFLAEQEVMNCIFSFLALLFATLKDLSSSISQPILGALSRLIQDQKLKREALPCIINVFGEIILALDQKAEAVIPHVWNLLKPWRELDIPFEKAISHDNDFLMNLRSSILDVCVTIILGAKTPSLLRSLTPEICGFLVFLNKQNHTRESEHMQKTMIDILTDLVRILPDMGKKFANSEIIKIPQSLASTHESALRLVEQLSKSQDQQMEDQRRAQRRKDAHRANQKA